MKQSFIRFAIVAAVLYGLSFCVESSFAQETIYVPANQPAAVQYPPASYPNYYNQYYRAQQQQYQPQYQQQYQQQYPQQPRQRMTPTQRRTGYTKEEIRAMPLLERPNRPGHFIGNSIRRRAGVSN